MTTVLALDTCDRSTGVAVSVGDEVRCWRVECSAVRHSVRLLDLVEEALAGAGVVKADLGLIAVTRGPGSFTGVRVGLSTAKGLAFALGIPVVGVSSLDVLWRGARPFPGVVVPVLDARKRQVYALAREGREGGGVLCPEGAWHPAEIAEVLAGQEAPCLFVGSGLGAYAEIWADRLGARFLAAPGTRWPIHPGEVALAGLEAFRGGAGGAPTALTPAYRRRSEAEESRRGSSSAVRKVPEKLGVES